MFASPPATAAGVALHGVGPPENPAAQLAAAQASAAHGGGPWGRVAALAPRSATPSSGPNLTFGVVMTYDASDGYVLAVSLNATAGPYNNSYGPDDLTWEFSGGNWSEISTVGQVPATLSPGLVYDSGDGYVLLYGGRLMDTNASVAPVTNQTWSYRAGVWTNLSGTGSPAPWSVDFANPVYDASDGYVLLYNEIGITPSNPSGYYNTTWTYAAGVWSNITSSAGTPPEMLGAMAYDAVDQYVVYFGGDTWTNTLSNATWTFHGGAWTNLTANVTGAPSPRMSFGMTYDPVDGYVVVYGGLAHLYTFNASAYSYETWSYVGKVWTLLASNGTIWSIQSMAYDSADNETVLLGSDSNFSAPPNVVTWAFSAGVWSVAAPIFLHPHWVTDVDHSFSFYVSRAVNEGGLHYRYSGLPPGCSGADMATIRCAPTSAGTYPVNVSITGAAGFLAKASTTLVVNADPTILGFSGPSPSAEVGIAAQLSVSADLGTGPLTYSYSGLPFGCASANRSVLPCVPGTSGSFNITATVTDALGVSVQATEPFAVAAALAVSSLSPDRAALDVGQWVSVTTVLTGGVGPFNYSYSGLPAGCVSANASGISCRPMATGAFSLRARTADALGAVAGGTTILTVNALPAVVTFGPSTSTIASGGTVSVSVTVSGGTAPLQYRYEGLPSRCTSAAGPVVSCSDLPSGSYAVGVTVTDATGANTSGTTSFVVLKAPSVLGPGVASHPSEPGFWWGFAVATLAIAAVAVVGGYRLVIARQGEEIVRKLRAEGDGPFVPSDPQAPTTSGYVGQRKE